MNAAKRTAETIAFVACIEHGVLETQTLRLFESLRRFGGQMAGCAAYAVSPRPDRQIGISTRHALRSLDVHHIEEHLNRDCPEYGSANRVAAAAHIEARSGHDIIVVLDSDTMFLREPTQLLLAADVDAAVRPVDVKGMCSAGESDPCDAYWQALCRLSGVDYGLLPWTRTTVDGVRIKASYNGGLVVTRSRLGILQRWADIFFASARAGVMPHAERSPFRAGAGWVESNAGRWWGSNQAALSLALWSRTKRVLELPRTYNYPLHLQARMRANQVAVDLEERVHVHYHWLLEPEGRLQQERRHDTKVALGLDDSLRTLQLTV